VNAPVATQVPPVPGAEVDCVVTGGLCEELVGPAVDGVTGGTVTGGRVGLITKSPEIVMSAQALNVS